MTDSASTSDRTPGSGGRRQRVAVMHGVNLDMLGRRDPAHYGRLDFTEVELKIAEFGSELGLDLRFFQTNYEGDYVEELHKAPDIADALLLNPGAWTHYAWAIHDALEVAGLPAVEVHLSDVAKREPWRRQSVIADLCVATFAGKGVEGYRDGLQRLAQELTA
ncbi:MAG TPA: type II 3-dehydroquinate dehydratase [Solirubrobacteraceae bacterium]|nr:type II 3-dehydroquinate dehydratase [Solirubrobacteraceae bacterium]